MKIMRQVFVALSVAACLVVTQREVSAAPTYHLCLAGPGDLYLNFIGQGQGVVVTGFYGTTTTDLHGPVFGTLAQVPATNPPQYRIGLTVTFANEGDELYNTVMFLVLRFAPGGVVYYKESRPNQQPTTGQGFVIPCPAF